MTDNETVLTFTINYNRSDSVEPKLLGAVCCCFVLKMNYNVHKCGTVAQINQNE